MHVPCQLHLHRAMSIASPLRNFNCIYRAMSIAYTSRAIQLHISRNFNCIYITQSQLRLRGSLFATNHACFAHSFVSFLQLVEEREKFFKPTENPDSTKDPFKTLFVGRLAFVTDEIKLKREFEE